MNLEALGIETIDLKVFAEAFFDAAPPPLRNPIPDRVRVRRFMHYPDEDAPNIVRGEN